MFFTNFLNFFKFLDDHWNLNDFLYNILDIVVDSYKLWYDSFNLNEFWHFYHDLLQALNFIYFGNGDSFFNDFFNYLLGSDNLLNFWLYLHNFFNNLWHFFDDLLNIRNYFLHFFNSLIYYNLLNNPFNFIHNNFLLFCDNNLLNDLRNLNNFLSDFFLNN